MFESIILFPYRNRKHQLERQLEDTVPLLKKVYPESRIVVIEQHGNDLFNRGALLNCGFHMFKNETKYFITHDIDIYPTERFISEFYKKDVSDDSVLGIYTSIWDTLGGIIKISSKNIFKVNGFPNDIWGWGAEDKALQNRTEFFGLKKLTNLTNNNQYPEYLLRLDDVNDRKRRNHMKNHRIHYHEFQMLNSENKLKSINSSGFNNLKYSIIERKKLDEIVDHIIVQLEV